MTDIDQLVEGLKDSQELINIIEGYQKNIETHCDEREGTSQSPNHVSKVDKTNPLYPDSIIFLLIKVIGTKPNLVDDDVKAKVVRCFKERNVKIKKMISLENLSILHESGSQLISWIKYESLMNNLIKEQIYEPAMMANEVLSIVKDELNPAIACKLASVIEGCVKNCRETANAQEDEEMEGKWCEIIDWMSWFLATKEDDFI